MSRPWSSSWSKKPNLALTATVSAKLRGRRACSWRSWLKSLTRPARRSGQPQASRTVKGVPEKVVRERFYERVAENAEPDEDPRKLAERLRKAFQRAVNAMMEQKEIFAAEIEARRFFCGLLGRELDGTGPPARGVTVPSLPNDPAPTAGQTGVLFRKVRARPTESGVRRDIDDDVADDDAWEKFQR